MDSETRHSVTAENIRRLLEYLPRFQEPGFKFGEWVSAEEQEDGTIQMGFYSLSDTSLEFCESLFANGFVLGDFDWMEDSWQPEAKRLMADSVAVALADLETLIKLLTSASPASAGRAAAKARGLLCKPSDWRAWQVQAMVMLPVEAPKTPLTRQELQV